MLKISQASEILNVHPQTLRRWEREGKITPSRTINGERRYSREQINNISGNKRATASKSKIIYCRVSSKKQSEDLQRQVAFMREIFPNSEVITDIGSGVNFRRPGLRSILERLSKGDIEQISLSHRDRLCRIGFELFQQLAEIFGCKIVVVNNIETSPEKELVEDLIAITTSFSARMHGLRKYGHKMREDLFKGQDADEENLSEMDEPVHEDL